MQYEDDKALELLSESFGLEVTCRQDDSQREEEMTGLLVRVRELESLKLTWRKCPDAPEALTRGSAAVDMDKHMVYVSDDSSLYAYKWDKQEWSKLPECPYRFHTLAVVGGLLTAIGGHKSLIFTNALLSLISEGNTRKWKEHFPPMPTKRGWTTVLCSVKLLVVIGGRTGSASVVAAVEVMDTETQQWLTASSLPFPLSMATATIVRDDIYILGGYDSNGMTRSVLTCSLTALLQSCQAHPPALPQKSSLWHQVADTPSYWSTCVSLSGELLAVSGCEKPTDGVYAYDPVTDSWSVISHMNTARWWCLAVALSGDRLMVVGGYTSVTLKCATLEVATFV